MSDPRAHLPQMTQEESEPFLNQENNQLLSNILRISNESNQKAIFLTGQLKQGREHLQKCLDKNQSIDSHVKRSNKMLKKIKGLLFIEKMSLWTIILALFLVDIFIMYRKF